MNFTKEIQVIKTVFDESKIKVGDKVLLKRKSPDYYECDEDSDPWEYEDECIVNSIYEDFICLKDLDYPGYECTITAKEIEEGIYVKLEIIK